MAYNTAILQGRFTSDATNKIIPLRSDVDWMYVYNETALTQAAADLACQFYWQRGMTNGGGWVWTKLGNQANDPLTFGALAANTGFFLFDSSIITPSAARATTEVSNAALPVISTGDTTGVQVGSIIRIMNQATDTELNGLDIEVGAVTAGVSITAAYSFATPMTGGVAAGQYRLLSSDAMFYPRHRFIINITQAANAVVTTSVSHGLTIGQKIRFNIPTVIGAFFGMTELDGVLATVLTVPSAGTFTVDVDTTAMTAFAWPTAAQATANQPYSFPLMVPVGADTGIALSNNVIPSLDATDNVAQLGMLLTGGAASPGGNTNDVMYWTAGKSFSVINE
jgi:hypothetical protein